MGKNSVAISIIVPVYNACDQLSFCIESILEQSFDNFELILINDGSLDNSLDLCKQYAEKDNRIIVVDKKNGGVSSARNSGLKIARGEWIAFIDADDSIEKQYLEFLHMHTGSEDATLIMQGYKLKKSGVICNIEFKEETFKNEDIIVAIYDRHITNFGQPWAKLYNKNIINRNKIKFDENIHFAEDMLFMTEYVLHCNTIKILNGTNYIYNSNPQSLSKKYNSFDGEFLTFEKHLDLNRRITNKFKCTLSDKTKRNSAELLMRCIFSMYVKPIKVERRTRLSRAKCIRQEYGDLIRFHYTHPNWRFNILKQVFLLNHAIFDLAAIMLFKC